MPSNAKVIIEFGPYESNGIVGYSEDRLEGMKEYFESKGHKVTLMKKIDLWDYVTVIVNDQRVFRCKLEDLDFGGDGELDQKVILAEKEVLKAYPRLS